MWIPWPSTRWRRARCCCATNRTPPREYLGRFWVDSLVHESAALRTLLDLVGRDKVALHGCDALVSIAKARALLDFDLEGQTDFYLERREEEGYDVERRGERLYVLGKSRKNQEAATARSGLRSAAGISVARRLPSPSMARARMRRSESPSAWMRSIRGSNASTARSSATWATLKWSKRMAWIRPGRS